MVAVLCIKTTINIEDTVSVVIRRHGTVKNTIYKHPAFGLYEIKIR